MRMTPQHLEPDDPAVVSEFFEQVYGNPTLDHMCHEWAVRATFELHDLNRNISVHQWQTSPLDWPRVQAIFGIDVQFINDVLNEEWGISNSELPTATYMETEHWKKCEQLHTKYWDYRAAWWYELIGHANVKNQAELARLGMRRSRNVEFLVT